MTTTLLGPADTPWQRHTSKKGLLTWRPSAARPTRRHSYAFFAMLLGGGLPHVVLAHAGLHQASLQTTLLHYLSEADHLLLTTGVVALILLSWNWRKRHTGSATSRISRTSGREGGSIA